MVCLRDRACGARITVAFVTNIAGYSSQAHTACRRASLSCLTWAHPRLTLAGAHGTCRKVALSHMGVHEPCSPGQCMRGLQPAEQRRAFQLQLQTWLQT